MIPPSLTLKQILFLGVSQFRKSPNSPPIWPGIQLSSYGTSVANNETAESWVCLDDAGETAPLEAKLFFGAQLKTIRPAVARNSAVVFQSLDKGCQLASATAQTHLESSSHKASIQSLQATNLIRKTSIFQAMTLCWTLLYTSPCEGKTDQSPRSHVFTQAKSQQSDL